MTNKVNKQNFTILIDTNAVTSLSLYLEACELVGKKPDTINNKTDLISLLEGKEIKSEWLSFEKKGGIAQGLRDFKNLKVRGKRYQLKIYFPAIIEIEALHVLMERRFDQELTRRLVPYRLRSKKVIRRQVDFNYEEIYENWSKFKNNLSLEEMELHLPEREFDGLIDDALTISNILMKYISLETIDSLLYAIGVKIGADEIYTHDGELKEVINNIAKGEDRDWQKIAKLFYKDLKDMFPSFKEEFDKNKRIKLPYGVP